MVEEQPEVTASGFEAWWVTVKHFYHPESLRVYAETVAKQAWAACERVQKMAQRLKS